MSRTLPAYRRLKIPAVALIVTLATCVEHRPPTSSEPGGPAVLPTATLATATITHTLLTSGHDPNNVKVYTTASIAPAPNALVTVAVLTHQSSSAAPAPTLTGGGMTAWDLVATVAYNGATPLDRVSIFRAMSASPGSGPITITSSVTVSNCQWIVSQWGGVETSGTNGAGAIVQTGSTTGAAVNGLTVSLAAFADPADAAYGVFGIGSATPVATAGSGFTPIDEQPSGEGTIGDLFAEWTVNDNTIDATWSSKSAGALGVELRAGGSGGGGGGGGGVSASLSTVAASPASITAGSGTSTITVTAKDANGNPISGATVVLAATGTGNTLTQPSSATDANGVATGALASTVTGAKVVSAKINGTAITPTDTVTVTPGAVSASQSTVTASPTSVAPGATSTITVTAKDANGNPISGATVVLAGTGMASITQPADTTSASGVATGTVSDPMEETVTVSATINGTAITQTADVQVVAQTAATITQTLLTSGNNAVNQRVYTTASISPAPNALVTVAVLMRRSSGALSPTISGGGMTAWDAVASADFDTQGTPTKRLTIFRAMSAAPGSGSITITFPSSVSNVQWIVSQWDGVDASGTNGSGAIAQTGVARSDGATSLTVPLATFASANDVAYGVVGVAKNGPIVTPGSGFTEIAEVSSGETSALEAEWATNQQAVGASWSTSTKAGMLAVEIKAGSTGSVEPVATVEVSPQSPSIVVGATVQLDAVALDAGGEPLAGQSFTWQTSDPSIATVSTSGLVTGVSAGGPVTITATTDGVSGTSSVTVTSSSEPVASVEVTPASADIIVGGTVQLTATPKDANGQPLSGRTITWATNASQTATVSSTGLVTGVAAGTATITATSEGVSGSATVTVTTGTTEALIGQWSAVLPAPIVMVHQHLLFDGRILTFGENGDPQVLDPLTGIFTAVPSSQVLICSGHTFLPDGRLLITGGGGASPSVGLPSTTIFDPATASWIVEPDMAESRWYPTNTTLPDGEVITISGQDVNGTAVAIPEIWNGTSWRQLTGASLSLPNYPREFVAPDGRVFVAGSSAQAHWLDLSGTGAWTSGPTMKFGSRSYGSAVMYESGKILYAGGNSTPTNTAEIIDLNQANPQWAYTGSMQYARWNLNATVLPDGQVVVTGGVDGNRTDVSLAVTAAEMWNPATGLWTTMASAADLLRGYHSTTLLLPDGRVLHAGGGDGASTPDNLNYQIYSPPYLFKGARPSVTGVTGSPGYGQTLTVQTPDAASIVKVTLIRFGSVTHAFDQAQLLVSLSFSQGTGGITVTLPASGNIAPPGPYMLFLVNGNGVPSVGRIMVLQ